MAITDHLGFCPVHSMVAGPASTLPAAERFWKCDSFPSVIALNVMRCGKVEVCGVTEDAGLMVPSDPS